MHREQNKSEGMKMAKVVKSILKHEKKLNNRKFSAIKCRKPVNRQVFEHEREEEEKIFFYTSRQCTCHELLYG